MTTAEPRMRANRVPGAFDAIEGLKQSSLEAVGNFLDTLNAMFPDIRDDGPRQQVIDSAFKMVESLVGTSNELARSIVAATKHALDEFDRDSSLRTG